MKNQNVLALDLATKKHEVTLPYPPSANRYWRHRAMPKGGIMTYISKDGQVFRAECAKLLAQGGISSPIKGRVGVAFTLYPQRPQDWQKRQRKLGEGWHDSVRCIDLDNAQKALLDALKGIAFDDDVWVREIVARRAEPDEVGARLEVVVYPLGCNDPQEELL